MQSPLPLATLSLIALSLFSNPAQSAEQTRIGSYDFQPLELGNYRKAAFGVGLATNTKPVDSEVSFVQLSPEVFGYSYYPINSRWSMRPGLRLGYSWMNENPNLPQSLQITERDLKGTAEVGFLWNYYNFIPAFSFGTGLIYRSTNLKTGDPILSSDQAISGRSTLPFVQGQFSIGMTVLKGFLEMAPFARYTHVFSDSRFNWSLGTEVSISLFKSY